MKNALKNISLLGLLVILLASSTNAQSEFKYNIGQKVNDFHMFDIDSKKHATKDVQKKVIVMFFIGNSCIHSDGITKRMKELYEKYNTDVEFWAVNSNNPNFSPADATDKMKEYSIKYKLPYPYMDDLGQFIASEFSIKQYPIAVILLKDGDKFKYVYKGNLYDGTDAKRRIVDRNINNALTGKPMINTSEKQQLCDLL